MIGQVGVHYGRLSVLRESFVHLVRILKGIYFRWRGEVVGKKIQYHRRCVARVHAKSTFGPVLRWETQEWRAEVGNPDFIFIDGGLSLLDLRLADDSLIFARWFVEHGNFLGALVKQLDRAGLLLNPDKTVAIANEN